MLRAAMPNREKLLAARHSAFQAIQVTEDAAGLRTLRFGEDGVSLTVVSVDDPGRLVMAYTRLLPACLAFVPRLTRLLVVGLGGGALPRFFRHHFAEAKIDVVEIDAEVVALAREFCGFAEDEHLQAFVEDGRDFIEASDGGYDVIILDSFDAESIPRHLSTLEFAQAVRRALSVDGIAVANVWGRSSNPLYESMLLTYRAAFEDVYVLDVPTAGSKLFVALPRQERMTRERLLERARQISLERRLGYDLCSTIAGVRNAAEETVRSGCILRDGSHPGR